MTSTPTVLTDRLTAKIDEDAELEERSVSLIAEGEEHWLQWLNIHDDPLLLAFRAAADLGYADEMWHDEDDNAFGMLERYARFGTWVVALDTQADHEVRDCGTNEAAQAALAEWVNSAKANKAQALAEDSPYDLFDADTAESIRPATRAEYEASASRGVHE